MDNYLKEITSGGKIAWVITNDYISDGENINRSNVDDTVLRDLKSSLIHKFRIYDSDGELYYEGLSTNQDCETAFEPLDWAMYNDGATDITYLNNGKWSSL